MRGDPTSGATPPHWANLQTPIDHAGGVGGYESVPLFPAHLLAVTGGRTSSINRSFTRLNGLTNLTLCKMNPSCRSSVSRHRTPARCAEAHSIASQNGNRSALPARTIPTRPIFVMQLHRPRGHLKLQNSTGMQWTRRRQADDISSTILYRAARWPFALGAARAGAIFLERVTAGATVDSRPAFGTPGMLAAIAGFLPGYLRQHRQHRLPNQSTIPVRPRGWTRSLSIVADAADGADAVMGSVLSSMAIILIVRMPNRPSEDSLDPECAEEGPRAAQPASECAGTLWPEHPLR
jgi:hypothetical protein